MKRILFLLAVSLFACSLTCFASISITGQTGIIKITPPGITIKAGQAIPSNIPDGATIEIVTGTAAMTTTAPSTVNFSVKGNTISLPSGSTVQVALNVNGAVKVSDSKGTSTVKTSDGKTTSLKQGQTIVIAGGVITNAEAYQPPIFPGSANTQVQIDDRRIELSPSTNP